MRRRHCGQKVEENRKRKQAQNIWASAGKTATQCTNRAKMCPVLPEKKYTRVSANEYSLNTCKHVAYTFWDQEKIMRACSAKFSTCFHDIRPNFCCLSLYFEPSIYQHFKIITRYLEAKIPLNSYKRARIIFSWSQNVQATGLHVFRLYSLAENPVYFFSGNTRHIFSRLVQCASVTYGYVVEI